MTTARKLLGRTFSAFAVRNFRLYFTGQVISVSGSWMQRVARVWLLPGMMVTVGEWPRRVIVPRLRVARRPRVLAR